MKFELPDFSAEELEKLSKFNRLVYDFLKMKEQEEKEK
jgi:hypothetical protein